MLRPSRLGTTALVALAVSVSLGPIGAQAAAPDHIDDMIIEAHRGGPKLGAPENTLKLFKLAVKSPAVDRIETDVRATEDDIVVVHHNATLSRSCSPYGGKAIRVLTWSQLSRVKCSGQPVPQLSQALATVRGTDVAMNVEMKLDTTMTGHQKRVFARETVQAIESAKLDEGQASISSYFWRDYAATVHKYAGDTIAMTAMELSYHTDPTEDVFSTIREAKSYSVDRMWFSVKDAHRDLIAFMKDYGGMQIELIDRSSDNDTRYAVAHGLRVFANNDPVAARKSVMALLNRLEDKPLKKRLTTTSVKAITARSTTLLRNGDKTYPQVVGSGRLSSSVVRRLEDIRLSVTIKGHGTGHVEVAPSGSRPGTDGVRIPMPDGTKTYTVSVGPGDGGRIRVMATGTSKVSVKITGYRTTSY